MPNQKFVLSFPGLGVGNEGVHNGPANLAILRHLDVNKGKAENACGPASAKRSGGSDAFARTIIGQMRQPWLATVAG